jgi:predicted RNA-binding Zn ribbon-like protein
MLMAENNHSHSFEFIGGALCLNFANTTDGHDLDGDHHEYLTRYDDLLRWAAQAGILTDIQLERIGQKAEDCPAEAAALLDNAILFREAIYRIFSQLHHGQQPPKADIDHLNLVLSDAMAHASLSYVSGNFLWDWPDDNDDLQRVLWPVARSAAELLLSAQRERVHLCANDTCGWVFLDTSKNHRRRWCSMESCGNLAKVRKHRKRQQK